MVLILPLVSLLCICVGKLFAVLLSISLIKLKDGIVKILMICMKKIEDKQEANQIINSIKICDPAVGSGHFLVSALNEIIALKSELNILLDRQGKTIKKN